MKDLVFGVSILMALGLLAGCSGQEEPDWYDQTEEHNQQRDDYIEAHVEVGMTPEEARQSHDSKYYEMITINMVREEGAENLDAEAEFQTFEGSVEPEQ